MRITFRIEVGRKSAGTVIFAVVEINDRRRHSAGRTQIQPQRVDQCLTVDRFGGDPVGGDIPAAAVHQGGNGRPDCLPFLLLVVPDAYPGVERAAVADHAFAGRHIQPVAPDEVAAFVPEGFLSLPRQDHRIRRQTVHLVADLLQTRHGDLFVFLPHPGACPAVCHRNRQPVQVQIHGEKQFPEPLVAAALLHAPDIIIAQRTKDHFLVGLSLDPPVPVPVIIIMQRGRAAVSGTA